MLCILQCYLHMYIIHHYQLSYITTSSHHSSHQWFSSSRIRGRSSSGGDPGTCARDLPMVCHTAVWKQWPQHDDSWNFVGDITSEIAGDWIRWLNKGYLTIKTPDFLWFIKVEPHLNPTRNLNLLPPDTVESILTNHTMTHLILSYRSSSFCHDTWHGENASLFRLRPRWYYQQHPSEALKSKHGIDDAAFFLLLEHGNIIFGGFFLWFSYDLGYPKIHGIFCDFPWNRPSIDWGSPINWNPPGDPQGMWLGWVDTTPKARFLSGSIGYVLWKAGFSLMMFAPSGYQGCSKAELNVIEVCGIYVSLFCNVFPIFWNCLWIFS